MTEQRCPYHLPTGRQGQCDSQTCFLSAREVHRDDLPGCHCLWCNPETWVPHLITKEAVFNPHDHETGLRVWSCNACMAERDDRQRFIPDETHRWSLSRVLNRVMHRILAWS